MKCTNPACSIETTNPKYCSKTCSAIHTNTLYPKRKVVILCIKPGCTNLHKKRSLYCADHRPTLMREMKTIEEAIYLKHHQSSAFALIRSHARNIYFKNEKKECKNCGYTKHIEICHIKPISAFHKKSLLTDVNNPLNLIGLCPNCHWEFDNGLLVINKS